MKRVRDKVALVTGGAAGLGAAIVERLLSEGASVIFTDVDVELARELASRPGCSFLRHDVTDEPQWLCVVDHIKRRYGSLHILVNNAGIEGPFDRANPENTLLSDWQAIERVNVEGVFLGCRAVIPLMRDSGGGAIINISSTAGLVGTPEYVAYGSSKAAVLHLTKSVALHCARNRSKIRCNSVHPGIVRTPMLNRIIESRAKDREVSAEHVLQEFLAAIPQGEFQTVDDVASMVLFLASDEARHITGARFVVDGGGTAAL